MNEVSIKTIGGFRILLKGRELPFSNTASEFLSLLVCMRGGKVTAKSDWEIVYKDEGKPYSAKYYMNHTNGLLEELALFGLSDIVRFGTQPIRSCRLILNKVDCDYFDMLENKIDIQPKELFLPEYEWAQKLYCSSLEELRNAAKM